jgi:hypothetical protein
MPSLLLLYLLLFSPVGQNIFVSTSKIIYGLKQRAGNNVCSACIAHFGFGALCKTR